MVEGSTKKCVVCGAKAVSWNGHVIMGGAEILAGWCKKHKYKGCPPGFYGHYKRWMGRRRDVIDHEAFDVPMLTQRKRPRN